MSDRFKLGLFLGVMAGSLGTVLFVLVLALIGCGPDGPALPPSPDFAARPCATVPVCSPDMGRDLSTVEDLRYFIDLAAQP